MSDWNTTEGWNSGFNGAASGAQAGMSVGGPIGAVVGGIGGLVGGLFGHKKSTDWNKKYFNESVRQFNVQDEYNKNQVQYRVKDALAAGINPLAALGVSSNVSPTISTGGGSSSGTESGGFNNFLTSMSNIFNKQEKESRDLDLEAKRIRNRIAKEELNHLLQPGIVSNGTVYEGHEDANVSWRVPMRYDLRDAKPLYKKWIAPNGSVVELIDPDAIADADVTNMEAVRAYGSDMGTPARGIRDSLRNAVGARESYFSKYKNKIRKWTDSRSWWR